MDVTDITPLLDQLDGNIDNLEDALEPLLKNLHDVSSKLPLLDKAKLFVLVSYSIESALFSSLRLQGIDAKQHPVFKELTRIRRYFQKIKELEEPPAERTQTVDKQAAIRFLKGDLADDKEINTKLKELLAKERAKAALKGKGQKRPAEDSAAEEQHTEGQAEDESAEEGEVGDGPSKKKSKKGKSGGKKKGRRDPTVKGPLSR